MTMLGPRWLGILSGALVLGGALAGAADRGSVSTAFAPSHRYDYLFATPRIISFLNEYALHIQRTIRVVAPVW